MLRQCCMEGSFLSSTTESFAPVTLSGPTSIATTRDKARVGHEQLRSLRVLCGGCPRIRNGRQDPLIGQRVSAQLEREQRRSRDRADYLPSSCVCAVQAKIPLQGTLVASPLRRVIYRSDQTPAARSPALSARLSHQLIAKPIVGCSKIRGPSAFLPTYLDGDQCQR